MIFFAPAPLPTVSLRRWLANKCVLDWLWSPPTDWRIPEREAGKKVEQLQSSSRIS